jgi:hypothetical protein
MASSKIFKPSSISAREMFKGGVIRTVLSPHPNVNNPLLKAKSTI